MYGSVFASTLWLRNRTIPFLRILLGLWEGWLKMPDMKLQDMKMHDTKLHDKYRMKIYCIAVKCAFLLNFKSFICTASVLIWKA